MEENVEKNSHCPVSAVYFDTHKHCNLRILSLIRWTPGANMGFYVSISPVDGKSQSKPMMEHSKNYECVACTVGINTHHYAGSLCSGTQTKTADPKKSISGLIDQHPPLCLLFFLAREHTPS